jgi:hypothetical protein
LLIAVALPSWSQPAHHQFTQKEAELLALSAPQIFARWCRHCCPVTSGEPTVIDGRTIWIQVRCDCGKETGGMLIDNFTVDPVTGEIWETIDLGTPEVHQKTDTTFIQMK